MSANSLSSDNTIVNAIGFQAIWWSCILLGNLALPLVACLIVFHIYFHSRAFDELRIILFCGLIGFLLDAVLTAAGIFEFGAQAFYGWPPAWLLALWFGFSATLRNSLDFFRKHMVLAALLGAISGAGSYLAAERLGAVDFPLGLVESYILLAAIWALLFPAIIYISQKTETQYA